MTSSIQRRGRALWIVGGALLAVAGVGLVGMSAMALVNGDTTSTTRVRGADVPTWSLGLISLALVPLAWWQWRREAGATIKHEGLINIQPISGGVYLVGNYGPSKGVSLPVADNSLVRIALVKTHTVNYGLNKLYGLRMASAHGNVLMDLQLMPKALDLSPLLADLRRRRVTVDLDPALDACHDHGAAPHVAPPSGPAPEGYHPQPAHHASSIPSGWDPR